MNLGLHVIQFPSGKFGFVGSIPTVICLSRKPTASDIMGGRVMKDGLVYYSPSFDTRQQAIDHAKKHGFEVKQ